MMNVHGLACALRLAVVAEEPSAIPAPADASASSSPDAESLPVLVVGAPADDAAVRRIAAELEAIGFAVQIEITTDPSRLASVEREDGTSAAWRAVVRVDTTLGEAHLLVQDGDGHTSARIVERGADELPASEVVLAHRTVEMLRASLRQLTSDDAPAPAPVVPTPAVAEPPRVQPERRYDRLFVIVAAAITGSPGGLAPIGHASVGLRLRVHPRVSLAVRGTAPVHPRVVRRAEGRATVWLGMADAWLFVGLARPSARWQPDLGVGAGVVALGLRGAARAPWTSRSDLVAAATMAGGAGLSVWLHPRVRVRLDAFVGAAVPRPAVRFGGREVAAWGRPFAGGTFGVEIGVL
jgi:hypothetical protein